MNINSTGGLNAQNYLQGVCLKPIVSQEVTVSRCVCKAAVLHIHARAQMLHVTIFHNIYFSIFRTLKEKVRLRLLSYTNEKLNKCET